MRKEKSLSPELFELARVLRQAREERLITEEEALQTLRDAVQRAAMRDAASGRWNGNDKSPGEEDLSSENKWRQ